MAFKNDALPESKKFIVDILSESAMFVKSDANELIAAYLRERAEEGQFDLDSDDEEG